MQIRWFGHSCFEFRDSDNIVLIDPHDGKSIGIKPPVSNANIVLITHNLYDHNATRVVKLEHLTVRSEEGTMDLNGLKVTGFPCPCEEGTSPDCTNKIYKFTMNGISICHCGDLENIPSDDVMEKLKGTDLLFVPAGEVNTIPLPKLKEFVSIADPKILIPMHYRVGGLTVPLKNIDGFIDCFAADDSSLIYVGNEIELEPEDIQEFRGICVFDL